jgi:SAM-dependent methyltransferase
MGKSFCYINVPDGVVKLILYQRTECLQIKFDSVLAKIDELSRGRLYKFCVNSEARLRKKAIKERFNELIFHEYEQIAPYLAQRVDEVLDIGCGLGAIDVLLERHYHGRVQGYYLVDKTQTEDRVCYGFQDRNEFYNSLVATKQLLMANRLDQSKLHLIEATGSGDLPIEGKVDLCVSLVSWGFHYPVRTYLASVKRLLRKGGTLILDVRKGTGEESQLEQSFQDMEAVFDGKKRKRFAITA